MERATMEAEKAAKQAQEDATQAEHIRQYAVDFWDSGWLKQATAHSWIHNDINMYFVLSNFVINKWIQGGNDCCVVLLGWINL